MATQAQINLIAFQNRLLNNTLTTSDQALFNQVLTDIIPAWGFNDDGYSSDELGSGGQNFIPNYAEWFSMLYAVANGSEGGGTVAQAAFTNTNGLVALVNPIPAPSGTIIAIALLTPQISGRVAFGVSVDATDGAEVQDTINLQVAYVPHVTGVTGGVILAGSPGPNAAGIVLLEGAGPLVPTGGGTGVSAGSGSAVAAAEEFGVDATGAVDMTVGVQGGIAVGITSVNGNNLTTATISMWARELSGP